MPAIKGLFYANQNEIYSLLNVTKSRITGLLSTDNVRLGNITANYSHYRAWWICEGDPLNDAVLQSLHI